MRLLERDIFAGVYGLAVGDALGVPVEFMSRLQLAKDPVKEMRGYGTHNQPKGTWSDDTSMVLATLDAMSGNVFSLEKVMDNFFKWCFIGEFTVDGKTFDVGSTTFKAINRYRYAEYDTHGEYGLGDINDNGNGSLMRMLPVAYHVYTRYGIEVNRRSVDLIYAFSGITHAHIISKMMCVYYVYIAMYIMLYKDEHELQVIITNAINAVDQYYSVVKDAPLMESLIILSSFTQVPFLKRATIKSTGYVVDSLEASIWCLYNSHSYGEAVELAVNLGGDTDTIGAITGSLAGLYYGLEDIPKEWIAHLRNKDLINSICNRYFEKCK